MCSRKNTLCATPRKSKEMKSRDPRLVQQDREGLQQEFKSDELKSERPTEAAKGQNYEDPRRRGRFGGVDPRAGPRSTGA
jgi:hypothetical protein